MVNLRISWLKQLILLLKYALLHVSSLVFFRRRAGNLFVFGDEGGFEFLNLLTILDWLSFDLWNELLIILWNILLLSSTLGVIDRLNFTTIKWCAWDFWSALKLRRQISLLKLLELVLNLLLSFSRDRSAFVVVINILLGRVDNRVCVSHTCCLRRLDRRDGTHWRPPINTRVWALARDTAD